MFTEAQNHWIKVPDKPGYWVTPLHRLEEARVRVADIHGVRVDQVVDYPQLRCRCCGRPAYIDQDEEHVRCHKHRDKNPCAIEGCEKTRIARGSLHDGSYFLCRDHWRMVCPPGSMMRRANNRFFRLAKKLGYSRTARWPAALEERYRRFWLGLVRRARKMTAGDIDMDEINALFGWDG